MQREHTQAALALILGPETEYQTRIRATRRLVKQGPAILPLVLNTLSQYPEITDPVWPWWPPQYEHLSHLLLHLSQQAHLSLQEFLTHPLLQSAPGPVLWTSLMETAGRIPHQDNEPLLCQGLESPWMQVRYAAAMALALRARSTPLHASTRTALRTRQQSHETLQVRLTASYALLSCGEQCGLEHIIYLLLPCVPTEVRKAATFILATELPLPFMPLTHLQREQIVYYLLKLLSDPEPDIAQHSAHALGKIATPAILPVLYAQLETATPTTQVIILTVLEEVTQRKHMRYQMRQQSLLTHLLPLLRSSYGDVCRQACYTLAACGGEYAAAVLGTLVMQKDQATGRGEALESLRYLRGALRAPLRGNVIRWLLGALHTQEEVIQITALDTLTQLLWQAQRNGAKRAWQEVSLEIIQDETALRLLAAESAWIRQHALELLPALADFLHSAQELHAPLENLLLRDNDSGVRACVAHVCARTGSRWAIPALLRALLDPDRHVAHTALNALARIATPDDMIVFYVITELARIEDENDEAMHSLGREASHLMKRWLKAEQDRTHQTLHSLQHPPIL